jgi:predicted NAD-dependent protein-ADP-ribosyltransferase YbiA (DUF1768 family)
MRRNWFSNFIPFEVPMDYQGLSFRTPENFFQAIKSLDYTDRAKCSMVSAAQAKRLGRTFDLRMDWDDIKLSVMEYALSYKFSDGLWLERLRREDGPFVEWNTWHDNFWGHCTCRRCEGKPHLNHLGKLMDKLQRRLA